MTPRSRSSAAKPLMVSVLPAAGEAGGEDHAVVSQHRGGDAMVGDGLSEGVTTMGPVTRWWPVTERA